MCGVFELTAQLNVVTLIIHREKNSSQLQSGLRLSSSRCSNKSHIINANEKKNK